MTYVLVIVIFTVQGVAVSKIPGYRTEAECQLASTEAAAERQGSSYRDALLGRNFTLEAFCVKGPEEHQEHQP